MLHSKGTLEFLSLGQQIIFSVTKTYTISMCNLVDFEYHFAGKKQRMRSFFMWGETESSLNLNIRFYCMDSSCGRWQDS